MAERLGTGDSPAKAFGVAEAIGLIGQQTTIINNLWSIYVVATFAIAGYGLTTTHMPPLVVIAVSSSFWLFALGHLALLRQALAIVVVARRDLGEALRAGVPGGFGETLGLIARPTNPLWISTAIHLLIDLGATAALLIRAAGHAA